MTLTEIANRIGCDKGTTAHEKHGYTKIYESAINEECTLLEIGIDNGLSLRMWAEWSEELDLIAIDNRTETMTDDLFMIADLHHCDQGSVDSLEDFANGMCRVDVIIDDGSHRPNDQLLTLEVFWKLLRSGGKYFIEDLHCSAWFPEAERAHARITAFAKRTGAAHSFFCNNKLAMLVKP